MAEISFDPEDYIDEIETQDLVAELMHRSGETYKSRGGHTKFDPSSVGIRAHIASEEFIEEVLEILRCRGGKETVSFLERELEKMHSPETIEQRYAAYIKGGMAMARQ